MQVQPYFPEPETVPGNIAAEQYDVRLRFIRRLSDRHTIAVFITSALTTGILRWVPESVPPLWTCVLLLGVTLGISSLLRLLGPGRAGDKLSRALLPVVLFLSAWVGAALFILDIDIWSVPLATLCLWLYARLCGRDFSFTGQFALAMIATLGILLALGVGHGRTYPDWGTGILPAVLWISYITYDTASLLQRRRANEVWLAVLDLFRDVLNIFTYGFRVIQHLRTFRI